MLVDFTAGELDVLNEWAQKAHNRDVVIAWPTDLPLLAKALDALARYLEAERVTAEPAAAAPVRYGALR